MNSSILSQHITELLSKYITDPLPEESYSRPINQLKDSVLSSLNKNTRFNRSIGILKICIDREEINQSSASLLAISCALRSFSLSFAMTQKYFTIDRNLLYNQKMNRWKVGQLDKGNILFNTPVPTAPNPVTTIDDNRLFNMSMNECIQKIQQLADLMRYCYEHYINNKLHYSKEEEERIGWSLLIIHKHPNISVGSLLPKSLSIETALKIIEISSDSRFFANACVFIGKKEPIRPNQGAVYRKDIYLYGLKILSSIKMHRENNSNTLIHLCILKSWVLEPILEESKLLSNISSRNLLHDMIYFPSLNSIEKLEFIKTNNFKKDFIYNHDDEFKPKYTLFTNCFLDQTWQSFAKITSDFDDSLLELIEDIDSASKTSSDCANNLLEIAKYILCILHNSPQCDTNTRINLLPIEMFSLNRISKKLESLDINIENIKEIINTKLESINRQNKINKELSGR
ncbi:hypothetical protein [Armatimonas sp.]|uniref:hypothetical protein n=1 Tax=Armatimonas sp. TaxID=1872638 RepID=UPI003750D002